MDWEWPVLPKYLFLMMTSFIVIMVLYEFVVKRVFVLRILFGMKGPNRAIWPQLDAIRLGAYHVKKAVNGQD